jgi:hypothetical protein
MKDEAFVMPGLVHGWLPCPLLAQSGHETTSRQCPLLGVNRTSRLECVMSAFGGIADIDRPLPTDECATKSFCKIFGAGPVSETPTHIVLIVAPLAAPVPSENHIRTY